MRDSYVRFFGEGHISKEAFFEFGLRETIYAPLEKANTGWTELKQSILSNKPVFIRGFGRDAAGTHLFQNFYERLTGNSNVLKDSTNNAEPAKLIRALTGYSKTPSKQHESIRNYQVSHIFGRTKNVYAFTAPWNIVYMPKMLDPFTGHEAKGELIDEYTKLFQQQGYKLFAPLIEDFNEIVTANRFLSQLEESLDAMMTDNRYEMTDIDKLRSSLKSEFAPIAVSD
jgi:hypothetical protein